MRLTMVLIAGVVAVLCWNLGNKIVTPGYGVLFLDLVPITAFAVEALGGKSTDSWQLVGILLSGSALVANNLYQRNSGMFSSPADAAARRQLS